MRKHPVLAAFLRLIAVAVPIAAVHLVARFLWNYNFNEVPLVAPEKMFFMAFDGASWLVIVIFHIFAVPLVVALAGAVVLLSKGVTFILFGRENKPEIEEKNENDYYDACKLAECHCTCHKGEHYDFPSEEWVEDPSEGKIVNSSIGPK